MMNKAVSCLFRRRVLDFQIVKIKNRCFLTRVKLYILWICKKIKINQQRVIFRLSAHAANVRPLLDSCKTSATSHHNDKSQILMLLLYDNDSNDRYIASAQRAGSEQPRPPNSAQLPSSNSEQFHLESTGERRVAYLLRESVR